MSKFVIVHGIGNQYVGESELHAAWYPALCDGLRRAGVSQLPAAADCFCPFYGDLFRTSDSLSLEPGADSEDARATTPALAELLEVIWNSAVETDPSVPALADYGETLACAPRIAELALNALSRSQFLSDYIPVRFFGDLNQVVLYLDDSDVHRAVLNRVLERIEPDTRVVIGHSLGSVVAYEALCAKPSQVNALVTLGSPLGIRNVVFDKLTPPPHASGIGHWPGAVAQWSNIAAKGDIVAASKQLAPLFGDALEDLIIDSGWDAHSSTRYLNAIQTGRAIARALR